MASPKKIIDILNRNGKPTKPPYGFSNRGGLRNNFGKPPIFFKIFFIVIFGLAFSIIIGTIGVMIYAFVALDFSHGLQGVFYQIWYGK